MKGPLQPVAAQQQQREPQHQQAPAAGAKENASLVQTTTTTKTMRSSSSPPPPAFEPVDDSQIVFTKSLALAKKVAETGDASVDLGGEDGDGKREKSGIAEIDLNAPGGVAALLSRVLKSAADLEGRCVGRNRDDAGAIRSGLVELAPAVGALERRAAEAGGGVAEVKKKIFRVLTKPARGEEEEEKTQLRLSLSLSVFSLRN